MLNLDEQNALRERYREANPGWRPATEVYASVVRSVLRPSSRLLDLGCGRGGLVEQLQHPPPLVAGLDPDFASLVDHRLGQGEDPLPRVAAVTERLPFMAGSFDLVMASWLLEHLQDPAACLRQVRRVLKPGGLFIFITPNRRHPLVTINRISGRLTSVQGALVNRLYGRSESDTFPAYYRANSKKTLEKLAGIAGMRINRLEAIADPTYLAVRQGLFPAAIRLESILDETRHIHLVGVMARK